jgi:hypothetical protein
MVPSSISQISIRGRANMLYFENMCKMATCFKCAQMCAYKEVRIYSLLPSESLFRICVTEVYQAPFSCLKMPGCLGREDLSLS